MLDNCYIYEKNERSPDSTNLLECQLACKLIGTNNFRLQVRSVECRLFREVRLCSKLSFLGLKFTDSSVKIES